MKRCLSRAALCRAAALAVATTAITATTAWGAIRFDRAKFMRVSEVRPGMLAVGKSVFSGMKIETFHLKIIAVMPKMYRGRDAVLARILDGPVVQRQSGLIGGMSGSPVFVNGRLLGAISFGWGFSKEPIAGITPIENMLAAQGDQESEPPGREVHKLEKPLAVGGKTIHSVVIEPRVGEKPGDKETMHLMPMAGMVFTTGLEGRARQKLAEVLEPRGLMVMQGPGGKSELGSDSDIKPGASAAVMLMSGDFQSYGVGTVTWREKNDVLAFGHAMMEVGKVDFPLHAAVVHEIIPSIAFSSKLASAGAPVGRLTQDRAWGVSGETLKPARTIPVRCSVVQAGRKQRDFHVQIVNHPWLSAGLAAVAALASVDDAQGYQDKGTAEVSVSIQCKGRPVIARSDVVFGARDVAASVVGQIASPVASFLDNDFGPLEIEKIDVRIELEGSQRTARLERLTARTQKVKAGEEVVLDAVLRPYRGEPVTRTVALTVPRDTPGGQMRIVATGGQDAESIRQLLVGARFMPTSADDLVRYYLERKRADALVVQAAIPGRGVDVLGRELPTVPGALADILQAGRSSDVRLQADRIERSEKTGWIISGRQTVTVQVEGRPGISAPKVPAPPVPPPTAAKPEQESEQQASEEEQGEEQDDLLSAPAWLTPGASEGDAAAAAPEPNRQAPAKAGEPAKPEKGKPLAPKPGEWVHSRREDYEQGKFDGISADSAGRLALSWPSKVVADVPQVIPFCVLASGGAIYVGTGHQGIIYRIDKDGKATEFFRTGQVIVHCLASDAGGNIYAGTSPDGTVWRIAPDGKGGKFCATGQKYVWSLSIDKQGTIYAGTGVPAKIYRISPEGKPQMVAQMAASHALSLLPDGEGGAWTGTGQGGVVYHVTGAGDVIPVLDTPAEAILSLARDKDGSIWAGCSPRGLIYRIDKDGKSKVVADTQQQHVFSLLATDRGMLAATANRGLVLLLSADDGGARGYVGRVLLKREQGDAVNLAPGKDGAVVAALSNPGAVLSMQQGFAEKGTFESPVLDATSRARWGRIGWVAQVPEGTTLTLQTRSGETPDPDDQWSEWSADCEDGRLITSPPARFFQYRATMTSKNRAQSPVLVQLTASYRAENRAPTITLEQPGAGEAISKTIEIKWKGQDPDSDTLRYDLSYSDDGGKSWKPIKDNVSEATYKWDVAKLPDRQHLLKVVASDRVSRAADAQRAEATIVVMIDNTNPYVMVMRQTLKSEEGKVSALGVAGDTGGFVRGVDWRLDSGEWQAAALNAVDAHQADFSIVAEKVAAGKHEIEVRAFDEAGNTSGDKAPITVAAPKPETKPETKQESKPAPGPTPAPK